MAYSVKLYANCQPIKGAKRSIILDLTRNRYELIPNDLYNIIIKHDGKTLKEIKRFFSNEYDEIINDYYNFLFSNEFVFNTNSPELFPSINTNWDNPSYIQNAIICFPMKQNCYKQLFGSLEELNCKALEIRLINLVEFQDIYSILIYSKAMRVHHIDLIIPWLGELNLDEYRKIIEEFPRVWTFKIFNAPYSKTEFLDKQNHHPIYYTEKTITDHSFCGNIHPNNFVQNIPFFTESQHYNTCLNRKLCIDENGYIKNCLSMDKHYGHISEVDIKEVVQSEEFQKLWHIKKDDIEVCRDCEFRHMCMDCRAFIKDPDNIYSQPAKCPYNPYLAKWKGQDGYITVEEWKAQQKAEVLNE